MICWGDPLLQARFEVNDLTAECHFSLYLGGLSADNLGHSSLGIVFDPFEGVDDLPTLKPLVQLPWFQ